MNTTISPLHWKMSLKKSIIIAFKRELIQLHVARSVCLVSLQQKKKSYETVHDFFPDGGHELDSQPGPPPFAPPPPPPQHKSPFNPWYSPNCGAAWWGHWQECIPAPPPRLLVSKIIPCSEIFPRQTCVSTSSSPIMCSNVMLSCGKISLLSRGVVREGYVAGIPPKPSVSPVCFSTSSNLLCLWRMKICKKTSWLTLLLNWTTSGEKRFLYTLHLSHQLMQSGRVKK